VLARGGDDDAERLRAFLARVTPGGVTPLAERLRALRPRFEARRLAASIDGVAGLEYDPSSRSRFLLLVPEHTKGPTTPHFAPTTARKAGANRMVPALWRRPF
jgi:hypothetical protein